MMHIIEAGTDGASLLLYDPGIVPEDFDATVSLGDPTETLSTLHDQGHLFWINTDGDGGYLLHAYIDEEPAEAIRPFLCEPETSKQFRVRSGQVFFMGAEYGYRDDDSRFQKYPHMGGSFPLECGTYNVTLYQTQYPDGLHEERFQERATPQQRFIHGRFGTLMAATGLSLLVTVICLFVVSWTTWFTWCLPVVAVLVLLTMLLYRHPVYQSADAIWTAMNNDLPSLVATFSRSTD